MTCPSSRPLESLRQRLKWMPCTALAAVLVPLALLWWCERDLRQREARSVEFHLASMAIAKDAMLNLDELMMPAEASARVARSPDAEQRRRLALLRQAVEKSERVVALQAIGQSRDTEALSRRLARQIGEYEIKTDVVDAAYASDRSLRALRLTLNQLSLLHRSLHLDERNAVVERRAELLRWLVPLAVVLGAANGGMFWLLWRGTQRVLASEATLISQVEASEARLRAILDSEPACVKLVDEQCRLISMNPAGLAMIEAESFEQVCGQNILKCIAPEHREQYRDNMANAFQGERIHQEYEIIGFRGTRRWADQHAVGLRDPNDPNRISMMLAVTQDITARKQAEEDLRASDERYALVERAVNDGIWDWNVLSGEVFYSRRLRELIGHGEDEPAIGIAVLYERLHPDDAEATVAAFERHVETGEPLDVTCRMHAGNDRWRWFRIRGESVRAECGAVTRTAGSLADITSQRTAEEELASAALTDKLTGLPNRNLFLDRLRGAMARARRHGGNYAVMFLDFDRFKVINDSFGHDVGDELLRQIAGRLQVQLRAVDTAGRFGGDEFVLLFEQVAEARDAVVLAERILAALAEPFRVKPHVVRSTASIGVVLGTTEYERGEDVLRDADTAMYEAKRAGKARFVMFDEAMHASVQRRARLESDLHRAIENDQLSLVHQPIVSLASGEISGVEALVRWRHPEFGPVPPSEFIPVAQESDLILRIGEWVMQQACRDYAEWRRRLGPMAPGYVNINLARRQFAYPGLFETLERALSANGLEPQHVQLEVTEEAFAGDADEAVELMRRFKAAGFKLAIDDFGSGSSTFAAVHQFPVDAIKVDRTLLAEIEDSVGDAALLHGLTVMGRNLGIAIVAEGIERGRQARAALELGCHYAQGYFFAKPMDAEALVDFVRQRPEPTWLVEGAMSFAERWVDRLDFIETV